MIMILQNAIVGLRQSIAAGAASLSDSSIRSVAVVLVLLVLAGRELGLIAAVVVLASRRDDRP